MNVMIVSRGIVCKSVVYGKIVPFGNEAGLRTATSVRMNPTKHAHKLKHHRAIQALSLYTRRPRGRFRGSGKENTSDDRELPLLGSNDSVIEDVYLVFGGCRPLFRVTVGCSPDRGSEDSEESSDGDEFDLESENGDW